MSLLWQQWRTDRRQLSLHHCCHTKPVETESNTHLGTHIIYSLCLRTNKIFRVVLLLLENSVLKISFYVILAQLPLVWKAYKPRSSDDGGTSLNQQSFSRVFFWGCFSEGNVLECHGNIRNTKKLCSFHARPLVGDAFLCDTTTGQTGV